MATHRPVKDDEALPAVAVASLVEYVGGPRDRQLEGRRDLPATIAAERGNYVRSVRCADDGAMRYVWRGVLGPAAFAHFRDPDGNVIGLLRDAPEES